MIRVLLFVSNTLFGQGIEHLFRQESRLEVCGCEVDVSKAPERVKALKPDVVILERREPVKDLGHAVRLMVRECEQLQVIEMDPEDDTMCIYSGRQLIFKQLDDLMGAIERL